MIFSQTGRLHISLLPISITCLFFVKGAAIFYYPTGDKPYDRLQKATHN